MRTESPRAIRLEEYRPSDYLIDRVDLDISLDAHATKVRAMLAIRPNPEGTPGAPLALDGDELTLEALALNGEALAESAYSCQPDRLTIANPPREAFSLTIGTVIDPTANTKLMGLYRSNGAYCTQCEAEGFRRITYFLDRPDVMAVYTTRIEAARDEAPILLGNGNPIAAGDLPGGRHSAAWDDPHPNPSYLFALVGGALGSVSRDYVTSSGRALLLAAFDVNCQPHRAHY